MSYAKSKFSASTDTSHSESSRTNPENSIHSETQSRKPILQSVSSEHTSSAQILSGSDHDASADIHTKKYPKDTTQDIGDNNTSEFNIQSNDKVINNVSPQKYTIPDASLTHNSTTDSIPNKNKQSTTNEIKYSLSRGVITLLDGSNSEFRTCEDCHRRRNGSELCRFVRLHSGPNWDDNRVPPQRISLPQGMVFKRIGGNNETVIRPFIAQNQKAVSGQNRITQPTNTMTMQAVVHPITSLASKFQLAGRRFRELPRPPCEEEEKPIDQLIRLEARVNEMQANVDFLLSRTHVRIPSTHSVLKDGTNNSDTTVYNMSQFFAALKDKIATAKMNRQPVKDIMLFAEVCI